MKEKRTRYAIFMTKKWGIIMHNNLYDTRHGAVHAGHKLMQEDVNDRDIELIAVRQIWIEESLVIDVIYPKGTVFKREEKEV